MLSVEDGTLVVYHGEIKKYRGDLCFVRESDINRQDQREYILDTIYYEGCETPWDSDTPIGTFGTVVAVRNEFTIVPIPEIPREPLEAGNYVMGSQLWRKTDGACWLLWRATADDWELRELVTDDNMRASKFLGPLPLA